jgi:hypothetical protein
MILRAIGYALKALFYIWMASAVYAIGTIGYQHSGWMGAVGAVILAAGLIGLLGFVLVTMLTASLGTMVVANIDEALENFDPENTPWLDAERNHAAAEGIELVWWKSEE